MLKASMYHYVQPFNERLPFFKNLHIEDFCTQLDYFEREFGFVRKQDFLDAFHTGKLPEGIILTFDDGLKSHYQYVLPELIKRKLWGIFYIPTAPYTHTKILDVHRIHLILGIAPATAVYRKLIAMVSDDMLPGTLVSDFREWPYHLQEDDDHTKRVKQILNYYISYEFRESVIDQLMAYFVPDDINDVHGFYLTSDETAELAREGMIIGSHTHSHPLMSKLNALQQREEIEKSFGCLERIIGKSDHRTFCYPYGGFHSFTDETERILTDQKVQYSFNVEHRDITRDDILQRPQALPRYDCNHFPFGQCRAAQHQGTVRKGGVG
ncbi:polysaccharide deacetylase family protein [Flavobacterium magnum]|nr:polysaccharide deacetylase family protein [Flavobacterium magnum]